MQKTWFSSGDLLFNEKQKKAQAIEAAKSQSFKFVLCSNLASEDLLIKMPLHAKLIFFYFCSGVITKCKSTKTIMD